MTRERLLAAARTLFREKGYPETSVADIVRAAGRAHGTFYLHFDNKQQIFAALLKDMIARQKAHSRAIWSGDMPVRSVWITVRGYLEYYNQNQDLWELLAQMAIVDQEFSRIRVELRQEFVHKIQRGIEQTLTQALEDLDVGLISEMLAAMVDEIARVDYLEGREWSTDEAALHITVLWARGVGYPEQELRQLIGEVRRGDLAELSEATSSAVQ